MIVSSIELAATYVKELSKRFRLAGKTSVIELIKSNDTVFSDSRFDKLEDCFGRLG